MKVGVTLCRRLRPHLPPESVLIVDLDSGEITPIDLTPAVGQHLGTSGACVVPEGWWVMVQGDPTRAVLLDAAGVVLECHVVPAALDPHGLLLYEDRLLIVASGLDGIVELDPVTGRSGLAWSFGPELADGIHVNSIFEHERRLCATAFGPRSGDGWNTAHEGAVFDLVTSRPILTPVDNPHSGCSVDGRILVCESWEERLVDDQGGSLPVGAGYARGLAVTPHLAVVGTSRRRPRHAPRPLGGCTLRVFQRAGLDLADWQRGPTLRLDHWSDEVFDVVALREPI